LKPFQLKDRNPPFLKSVNMVLLIRLFSNNARFFPAKPKISLSLEESNLFSTLLKNLPNTELRVAGGWVRDKLLNLNSQDIDISLNNLTGIQAAEILKLNLPNSSSLGVVKPNPAASKHLETACLKVLDFQLDLVNLRSEVYTDSRIPSIVSLIRPLEHPQKMLTDGI